MEINLFSKCIKELIVENDKVDVPYLGTFTAEMVPASYSDKQTTIHPPYRKMNFHKGEVSMADGTLLLEKVRRELGVTLDQAGVELGWCLSRLCSELEGRKSCKLPGLGTMRANARNEFFFVPDDDLDIWPDGVGFDAISIKVSEKEEMPDQVRHDGVGQAGHDEDDQVRYDEVGQAGHDDIRHPRPDRGSEISGEEEMPDQVRHDEEVAEIAGGISSREHFPCEREEIPEQSEQPAVSEPDETPEQSEQPANGNQIESPEQPEEEYFRKGRFETEEPEEESSWNWPRIILIALLVLVLLFIAASYLFTEQMSPILDRLLYTKEELELWKG